MEKFLSLLVSGGVSGSLYSLFAVGLVLTYASSRTFNLAHTGVAFSIAYTFYQLTSGMGLAPPVAAAVCVLVVAPALGLAVNRLVFRRLADAEDSARIVATVGVLIAVPAAFQFAVELLIDVFRVPLPRGDNVVLPRGLGPSPRQTWRLGAVPVDSSQVVALVAAAVCAAGLWWLLRRTRFGLRVRATVDRPGLAATRAVDTGRVSAATQALSFALAGVAGIAGTTFLSLSPGGFNSLLPAAAAAAVIGRLRSVPVALVGGIVVGAAQSLFAGYGPTLLPVDGLASALPAVLLLGSLLFLGAERRRAGGQVAEVRLASESRHLTDLSVLRRRLPWTVGTAGLLAFVAFTTEVYWLGLVTKGLAYAVVFLSFVIVTGIGGMVSLAQLTFALMSGLCTGMLLHAGWPASAAIAVALLSTVIVGVAVALTTLRLAGFALALATFSLAIGVDALLFDWTPFTNGDYGWGLPRPRIGPLDLRDDRVLAVVLLVVFGLLVAATYNVRRGRTGRAMIAVRSAEVAAGTVGVSAVWEKLRFFAFSAFVAGLGGVLLAVVNRNVTSAGFEPATGLGWLAIVVLFGVRRPGGALLAGLMFVLGPALVSQVTASGRIQEILFGLGAVQLARSPDGIVSYLGERLRRRPAPAPSGPPPSPTPPTGPTALRVAGLNAGHGRASVLHGVDLDVPAGSVTVLLGANGAGKSTLCDAIAGTLPATGGVVEVAGQRLTDMPAHERARLGLACVPEVRGIFPALTVADNLALTLDDPAQVDRALRRFPHLAERRRILAGHLSGGEQQLLAMAPFLVRPPTVLIADEPTLGLAPVAAAEVLALLRELADGGTAVLLAEERVRHVLELADQVVVLSLGRVVWAGPAASLDLDELSRAYLGGSR